MTSHRLYGRSPATTSTTHAESQPCSSGLKKRESPQNSFLPEMAAKALIPTLAELNRFLGAWQHEFYEQEPHDGLGGKLSPLAAWEADPTPLRPVDPARLNAAFLLSLERRVDKTALVSLHGVRYLCPDALVGVMWNSSVVLSLFPHVGGASPHNAR